MTPETAQIVAKLTEAQREALLTCSPWDVRVGAGIAAAFCRYDLLQESSILDDDDAVELTHIGRAVRAELEKK